MLELSSPSKRDRVSPQVVTVVPTVCEPRQDEETGHAEGTVVVASPVPVSTWSALSVIPEPAPREQGTRCHLRRTRQARNRHQRLRARAGRIRHRTTHARPLCMVHHQARQARQDRAR